jgi:hypothetical protein
MHHVSTGLDTVTELVRRLEFELDYHRQRADRLEKIVIENGYHFSNAPAREGVVTEEPQPTHRRMSISDARKAVMEFERKRTKDHTDMDRDEGRGKAV